MYKHILSLEKKGYLKRAGGEVQLAGDPSAIEALTKVPLVGLVPAGDPRQVFDASTGAVDVPDWMVGRRKVLGRVIGVLRKY